MPGINDAPEQVAAVVDACREAGATRVGGQALFLRGATKDVFMGHLRAQRPDLVARYEELYGGRAWLRDEDKRRVEAPLRRLAQRYVPGPRGPLPARRGPPHRCGGAAAAAEVATGRARPAQDLAAGRGPALHDALDVVERRRPQPVQEALF